MPIVVTVPSNSVLLRLPGFAPRLHARLVNITRRLAIMLQGYVKEEKLSGQVLHVRTGNLRRSINQRVDEDRVIGYVGTNVPYGRVHEFGFSGNVTVREHLRQARASGHWSHGSEKGSKWVRGKKIGEPVLVREHTRRVNLPERSFLRSALKDKRSMIIQTYQEAVREEFKK
jgi:phage gpG-like protein